MEMITSNLTAEQQEVYDILLMPIVCDRTIDNIYKKDGMIYTGQLYYTGADPDMSDFAVGFYKALYGIALLQENSKYLETQVFCGDTMNSYQKVAIIASETKKKEWFAKYHCLANFWILPMHVGHSSPVTNRLGLGKFSKSKPGIFDYMDFFLNAYFADEKFGEVEYTVTFKDEGAKTFKYKDYVDKFTQNIEIFSKKHFLEGSYIKNGKVCPLASLIKRKEGEYLGDVVIDEMWNRIKYRAHDIAQSENWRNLHDYFEKCKLI